METPKILRSENTKNYIYRLIIYTSIYTLITLYYPYITQIIYGYQGTSNDPYISYLPFLVLISFSYLQWYKIKKIPDYKNSSLQTIIFSILAIGILLIPITYVFPSTETTKTELIFIFYWSQIIISYIFTFIAVFNWKLIKNFKVENIVIVLGLLLYLTTQILVEIAWKKFSIVITYALHYILPLFTNLTYTNLETFNIRLLDFNVYIGAACTGIYSLATFTFLFITTLVFIRKKQSLDPFKSFIALLLGLIVAFILNIIRIVIIVLIGGFYSATLAINLFHEYLSAIFLITLFMVYLYWVIPKLIEKPHNKSF